MSLVYTVEETYSSRKRCVMFQWIDVAEMFVSLNLVQPSVARCLVQSAYASLFGSDAVGLAVVDEYRFGCIDACNGKSLVENLHVGFGKMHFVREEYMFKIISGTQSASCEEVVAAAVSVH